MFCNQKSITGVSEPVDAARVEAIIREHLSRVRRSKPVEAAFYGGSFTALAIDRQNTLLQVAEKFLKGGLIQAIRLSTRPDCLDQPIVDNLRRHGVKTVELGVQSMDDTVLELAERGYNSHVVPVAVARLQQAGIGCGIQLMPGLPGEDWASLIRTVRTIRALQPDFVRIYPTVVLAGTKLAEWFRCGRYSPLTLEEAVTRCAYMKLYFGRRDIPVIRTGLQDTEELRQPETMLAGPFHPAFGEMVEAKLYYLMLVRCLETAADIAPDAALHIGYPEREGSKLRGIRNSNLDKLKQRFGLTDVRLHPENLPSGQLTVKGKNFRYTINKNMICQI